VDKPDNVVRLRLHEKQSLVLHSVATEIFFGGALGGGKSHLVRALSIYYCLAIPRLQCFVFRRTYPEVLQTFMQGPMSYPVMLGQLVNAGQCEITQYEIRFANESRISMHHCQLESDVHKFQGSEIHVLCVDEVTHFSREIYETLRTRCRLGSLHVPEAFRGKIPLILLTSNPGGQGHEWVRTEFVDAGPMVLRKMPHSKGGMLRTYIPSLAADNPSLLKDDPDYLDRIRGMSDPAKVAAMLRGQWDIPSGAMYGAVWNHDLHVCKAFPVPSSWEVFRGMDDGFNNAASIHWIAKDPVFDRFYVVDEYYAAGKLAEELSAVILARDRSLLRMEPDGEIHAHNDTLSGIIDSAAFANTGTGTLTRGDQMNKAGCRWKPCEKYSGSRIHRVQTLHRLLALKKDGLPGLIFFDRCKVAVRMTPSILRSETNPEDIDDGYELVHAFDSLTYARQHKNKSFRTGRLTGY